MGGLGESRGVEASILTRLGAPETRLTSEGWKAMWNKGEPSQQRPLRQGLLTRVPQGEEPPPCPQGPRHPPSSEGRAASHLGVWSLTPVPLWATPRTVAHQAPLSMGFPRQGYWRGLPFPPPGDLPHPGSEPALAGRFFTTESPGKPSLTFRLLKRATYFIHSHH